MWRMATRLDIARVDCSRCVQLLVVFTGKVGHSFVGKTEWRKIMMAKTKIGVVIMSLC